MSQRETCGRAENGVRDPRPIARLAEPGSRLAPSPPLPGFSLIGLHDRAVRLDSAGRAIQNDGMEIRGRVHNGVVVLEGHPALPEGAAVTVTYPGPAATTPGVSKTRIQVPLVRTGQPDSVNLTGARIAEILDEEDASP